jgi:hypothetical protein
VPVRHSRPGTVCPRTTLVRTISSTLIAALALSWLQADLIHDHWRAETAIKSAA